MPNIKGNAMVGVEGEEDTYDVIHGQELASDILMSQEKSLVSLRVRPRTGSPQAPTAVRPLATGGQQIPLCAGLSADADAILWWPSFCSSASPDSLESPGPMSP